MNAISSESAIDATRAPGEAAAARAVSRNDGEVAGREYVAAAVAEEQWPELIEQFPDHTVFHSLPWLQSVSAGYHVSLTLLRVDHGGRCVAVWPWHTTYKGPLRIMGSPLPACSTAYMGPLFVPGTDKDAAVRACLRHDALRRCPYMACKSIHGADPVDLSPCGFKVELQFETFRIDLTQTEEQLWAKLKGECRTRIRRARNMGLIIRDETDTSFLEEYWSMSIETFSNTHIKPTFSREFLYEMWNRLREQGRVFAMSAWLDGRRIGMLVLPFDDHTMYYWGGASYLRYRGIPAHNLLHWDAILRAKALGLTGYDFIATLGGGGRFKSTFGPQRLLASTHWERTSSRIVRMLRGWYERYLALQQKVKPARH